MISCFKGGASGMWENGINNAHAAVYTSVSDFNQDEVPKISKIIESLRDYDVFKYSAYRTAFKLRTIQKASKLHMVDLSVIHAILKDYECSANSLDEIITPAKIENLMCALYTEASKKIGITGEPNIMALLFLAFLQNTFAENDKPLLFIHVKIALTLFSCAKLSEKYKYFFHFCSNGSTLSKQNLHVLLTSLSKIAEIVGEQVTFGSHLAPVAVKNLLKFKWLLMEPQTLVWISTLHRISTSETTQHFVSCDYCGVNPIIGLRYRCLQCISYNLCQNCFLCGRINKRHKERHQVQEFVLPASTWEETKATINTLKNKLPFAHCSSKPYLSFDEESIFESMRDVSKDHLRNSLMNLTLKKTTAAYIVKELSSIINKLESDKKNILGIIEDSDDKENDSNNGQHKIEILKNKKDLPNGDSLQSFKSNLDLQLERLKELLKTLQTPGSTKKELVKCISPLYKSVRKASSSDASKLSPIYLNSSSGFDESLSRRSAECNSSATPLRSSISIPCLKASSSTFTLNKDLSLEAMELELQTMLLQIENLLPQVSVLSNDSLEKEKVKNALSDMETAVKKLSHLSLTLSTGSTDL
ncbi:dystrophin-related protein 2 [Caerostris extrusa]|uniref:Dystrophin-related protein 2 n=1 Tax=Caerostris extrusa TaxID=172846 RepID=A0AAV4MWT6_CAEEX|nr:dystrophin-related protein 2 [Caerostris extrusa]